MNINRFASLALVVVVSLALGGCVSASNGAASPASAPAASQRDPSDDSYMDRYDRPEKVTPKVSKVFDPHLGVL